MGAVNLSGRVSRIDVAGKVVKKFIANPHCRFRPRSGISRSWKLCARRQWRARDGGGRGYWSGRGL